jgi:hypothetical protein
MNERDDNAVVIRLEVRVPLTGQPVTVQTDGRESVRTATAFEKPPIERILKPSNPAPVKVTTAGNFICASGISPQENGRYANRVYGRVFQGVSDPSGTTPPSGTHVTTVNYSTGAFLFPALPGAQHNSTLIGAPNIFVAWFQWDSPPKIIKETKAFGGLTSDHTECEHENSFLGKQSAKIAILPPTPDRWQLLVRGFAGNGTEAFNAVWVLDRRVAAGGLAVWDNGGNGLDWPLVELRYEAGSNSPAWALTFRLRGCAVSYTQPGTDPKALAEPGLCSVRVCPASAPESVPALVKVQPLP